MTNVLPMVDFLLQAASDSAASHIVIERGWPADVAAIGQLVVSILVVAMLGMMLAVLYALKRSMDELSKLVKTSAEPVRAVLSDAKEVTTELRALTRSIQEPTRRIAETVDEAGQRVRHALDRAEDRLERLDALVGIVQDKSERLVVRSASLARGMRVGSIALRALLFGGGREGRERRRKRSRAERREALRRESAARRAAIEDREEENGEIGTGPRIKPRSLPAH